MSVKLKAVVGYGLLCGASSADQLANVYGSWGLNGSLSAPSVNLMERVRGYCNTMCMWLGFSRTRSM